MTKILTEEDYERNPRPKYDYTRIMRDLAIADAVAPVQPKNNGNSGEDVRNLVSSSYADAKAVERVSRDKYYTKRPSTYSETLEEAAIIGDEAQDADGNIIPRQGTVIDLDAKDEKGELVVVKDNTRRNDMLRGKRFSVGQFNAMRRDLERMSNREADLV